MRAYHRVHVQLRKKDRKRIAGMLKKGWESARVLRRALVLRQLDRGQTAAQVAGQVGVASKTVRAIARRYQEEGLESALYEKARPGQPRRLEASQSQRVIALVCGPPPAGQARWSVRLIAGEAVKRKLVARVGRETIRILLRTHDLKPWRETNVERTCFHNQVPEGIERSTGVCGVAQSPKVHRVDTTPSHFAVIILRGGMCPELDSVAQPCH
jgi:transposase